MSTQSLTAKAILPDREWVEVTVNLTGEGIVTDVNWHALGCRELLQRCEHFAQNLKNQSLKQFQWAPQDPLFHHGTLLLEEVLTRLREEFALPYAEEELCHCRKVPAVKVDQAIVLGAHTPEKVTAWTSASSQCGTCRPDVQKLINYRLRKN